MKRASVVAPLLLIGIGVLFLARNMYPDLALIDYFARYWPTLLILWGMLRLTEILFWAATEKELPSRGMSGGEWILIVFLCMIGFSVHTVRGFETFEQPAALLRQPAIVLRNQEIRQQLADLYLVVVDTANLFRPVVAHIPHRQDHAPHRALHADIPLLNVRRHQTGVGDTDGRGGAQSVVLCQRARHLEGRNRNRRQAAARGTFQARGAHRARKSRVGGIAVAQRIDHRIVDVRDAE